MVNREQGSLYLDFGKSQVTYTITEALKVFEIASKNPKNNKSAQYWKDVENKELIPNRPAESLRNFYKTHANESIEHYMKVALEKRIRYCHAFQNIPLYKVNKVSKGDNLDPRYI